MNRPIPWDETLRRIANGEPAEDVIDEKTKADRERFRGILADMGPAGVAAMHRYDAAMRDLDSGVMTARSTWAALSEAQRRALHETAQGLQPRVRQIETLRNLERRNLIAWDGGAFTPEAKVVISERGRFVLQHGPTEAIWPAA